MQEPKLLVGSRPPGGQKGISDFWKASNGQWVVKEKQPAAPAQAVPATSVGIAPSNPADQPGNATVETVDLLSSSDDDTADPEPAVGGQSRNMYSDQQRATAVMVLNAHLALVKAGAPGKKKPQWAKALAILHATFYNDFKDVTVEHLRYVVPHAYVACKFTCRTCACRHYTYPHTSSSCLHRVLQLTEHGHEHATPICYAGTGTSRPHAQR